MNKSDHADDEHAPLSYCGARRILGLVVLLIILAFILRSLQSILLLFAIVFLVAMVLNPVVIWLERHRLPRVAAVALVMLALLAVAGAIVLFALPPLANQVNGLVQNAPHVWEGIHNRMDSLAQNYPAVREALPQSDEIASKVGAVAGTVGAAALVQILIDEFYLKPRHLDHAAIDREADALVEGKRKRL